MNNSKKSIIINARPLGNLDEHISILTNADLLRHTLIKLEDNELARDMCKLGTALLQLDKQPDADAQWYYWYASAEIERLATEAEALSSKKEKGGDA